MKVSRRLTVAAAVVTVFGLASVSSSAWAKGGGGGGGGGNPGSQPYIQFKSGGYSVTEGTTNAIIQVQRVPKAADAVNFSTNGSPNGAVGGADCSDPATDYVIQTNQGVSIGTNGVGTATVPICNNSYFENSETVNLVLSQRTTTPVGGKITATLSISDNDSAPSLSINNRSGTEGATRTFTVTASSSNPLLPMSVHWSTSDGTATVADGDYAAQSGDVAIAPGDTTTTFSVTSIDDTVYEPGANQYFNVNLSSPVNASLDPLASTGKFTLVDNDSAPTVTVSNNPTVTEGAPLDFTLSLSHLADVAVTGMVATWPGNAADPRYTPTAPTGVAFTIAAGSPSTTFSVPTTDDTVYQGGDVVVWSHILSAVNATIPLFVSCGNTDWDCTNLGTDDAWGYGTLQDNEPTVSIDDRSSLDASGTCPDGSWSISPVDNTTPQCQLTFTVTLSAPTANTVTVDFTTTDGTATAGTTSGDPAQDYIANSGSLTFNPGDTSKSVTVQLLDGGFSCESHETFTVDLSNLSGAGFADNQGTGTIIDVDCP